MNLNLDFNNYEIDMENSPLLLAYKLLTVGLLYQAYSLHFAMLQTEFGWSKTAFALAYSLQQLAVSQTSAD